MAPKRKSKLAAPKSSGGSSEESLAHAIVANRYKVLKKLGSGSYGTVYLISDLKAKNEL